MLCELEGESQGTGVLKTERNLTDKGRKVGGEEGGFYGEVLTSESLVPGKRCKDERGGKQGNK